MMNPGMYSSMTPHWATPEGIYKELDDEFHFTFDPCPLNADFDGLSVSWKGTVFVNPPYGRKIGNWIRKGWEESKLGWTIVMLLPARTDTRWWHDYVMKGEIRFIKGRLKFGGSKNSAPFPSCVVVFRTGWEPEKRE